MFYMTLEETKLSLEYAKIVYKGEEYLESTLLLGLFPTHKSAKLENFALKILTYIFVDAP